MAAAALAVLVAGCGGGDKGPDAGGEGTQADAAVTVSSLSKAAFVKQALAICHKESSDNLVQIAAYAQSHEGQTKDPTELFANALRAVILPKIETELDKIRKLGAPEGDEATIESFLSGEERGVEEIAKLKHVASRFQYERYFEEPAKIAEEYGIGDCAHYSSPPG